MTLSVNAPALHKVQGLQTASVFAAVMLLAILGRWLGYTGYFGSDEVTYTDSAFRLVNGDWRLDDYVGANRLGVNLPVAAFAWLFGTTEFAAALYSLLCSLCEVALVTWVAYRMFGTRAALFAGLLMASLPTHVHFAGRLMADSPLCLTITAAFVLFYEGEVRRWPMGYFLAGVCAGLSFWIKPVTLFVFGILLVYPLLVRRLNWHWLWMAVGLVLAMAANGLVFKVWTGNFWYVFDVTRERLSSGYLEAGMAAGEISSGTHFYLTYLFGKIYHTGLLAYLAVLGVVFVWIQRRVAPPAERLGAAYVMFWALGLLLILSVLPVGFKPLIFISKQTNYMLIFVAPLCLLAGYGLARMPLRVASAVAAVAVLLGLLFALLLQGSVAVFTANSWATLRYVKAHPGAHFYVMSNAYRAAQFNRLVGREDLQTRLHFIREWNAPAAPATGVQTAPAERYAVVDEESYRWDTSRPFSRPQDVPPCWIAVETIRGRPEGLGAFLLHAMAGAPGLAGTGIGARLQGMASPKPAHVYRLPLTTC